jgi:3-polyprenyl-4-hydroxybenzoate decarboxylase
MKDIDPKDADAVNWAITMRCEPAEDVRIVAGREKGHAPPFRIAGDEMDKMEEAEERSAEYSVMMMNATLKEPFPPVALPSQHYLYGEGEGNLGEGTGPSYPAAAAAVVWLLLRTVGCGVAGRSGNGVAWRVLQDGRQSFSATNLRVAKA